jgi:3'(2'), 5'-bisphosphate nucleotidase
LIPLTEARLKELASIAIDASKLAGETILSYYRQDIPVNIKKDGSPLTMADKASDQAILDFLSQTGFPVVSEESPMATVDAKYYWLVDPLDGTKDFLAANDEFTINIALMEDEQPVIGIVYAPALTELYVGVKNAITWKEQKGIREEATPVQKNNTIKMAISRFHDHNDAQLFADANQIKELIPIGSALKYGRLAFGEVDIYPRMVGTSEWDTAAGQAVLECAGGSLLDWGTAKPLSYNKTNRRNGRFIAYRTPFKYDDFTYQNFKPELL